MSHSGIHTQSIQNTRATGVTYVNERCQDTGLPCKGWAWLVFGDRRYGFALR